jgi:hypothetical protein
MARQHRAGRNIKIAVRSRALAKLQGHKKGPFGAIATGLDPLRRSETAGTLTWNKLALRPGGTALALHCVR